MIFRAPDLPSPSTLRADLCVVGSGAGGATVARVAAEAGLRVVVVEAGEMLTPADMCQREEVMFPRLYWESGGRATADRKVRVHQGRGVGGSTLHNLNLCKRIPDSILARWGAGGRLSHLPRERWAALYDEVEHALHVSEVDGHNLHNALLERACGALGWRGGPLRHNRSGCARSGFCEVGCAYDAKNNALKVMIPPAVRAGADVLTLCQAVRIGHDRGGVQSIEAVALDPVTRRATGPITIVAPRICLSASATGTAALLERSAIPDPSNTTGRTLRMHPAVVVAAELSEPVDAHIGIPQSYECTEWLDLEDEAGPRVWIVPAFAHPAGTATTMPGHGDDHRRMMRRYRHLAVLTAMIHDHTVGRVTSRGELGLRIDYAPDPTDRAELRRGLWACAKLLQAAGAERVHVPAARTQRSYGPDDAVDDLLGCDIDGEGIDLTAVHPMATVSMDDDPSRAAVGSDGRHHHVGGLWIADGSLFPSSIGVPPQLSIYALGLHVGRAIAES